MDKKYYAVMTRNKERGEIWFDRLGDDGHLLCEKAARILFDDLDTSLPGYETLLCEITLAPDLTISIKVMDRKEKNVR